MSSAKRIPDLEALSFSQTLVKIVDFLLDPRIEKAPNQNDLYSTLFGPLEIFMGRFKMELYFLFADEAARFGDLNEDNIEQFFESIRNDITKDKYDPVVFAWFCLVLSYYAAIAQKRSIKTASKVAGKVIYDTIVGFKNDTEIADDVIESIKISIIETAERIAAQNESSKQ